MTVWLTGVEWVHCLFLLPLVLGKTVLSHAKLGLFLCSLDNLLQKNVIVFFFGNQIPKWRSFEKRAFLTYFSHFLVTWENYKNSCSTYVIHIHTCILFTLLTFFALPILKKKNMNLSGMVSLWYESWCVDYYSHHFGTINKYQNGEQNLSWNVYYWCVFTLMPNL